MRSQRKSRCKRRRRKLPRAEDQTCSSRTPFPAVEGYYQRLQQRPAFIEHVMVSYEDLRVI
ncbi:hypothetical protein BSU01_06885 [Erwinia billingiae]|nr:hypothetical protein [Erwinia billingiae]